MSVILRICRFKLVHKSLSLPQFCQLDTSRTVTQQNSLVKYIFSSSARHYAKQASKLSFEKEAAVIRDVTVFSYSNERFFKMMSVFGVVQIFFWWNMASFATADLSKLQDAMKKEKSNSIWSSIYDFQTRNKYRIAASCAALGMHRMLFLF